MKTFAIASVLALATVGSAQLNNIPQCALSCFIGPLTSDGCSSLTDFKCHCQKGAQLLSSVQPCVEGACSSSDKDATIAAVQKTCAENGAPIQIPGAGAASSAVASATSAAASVVSSKAAVASSAAAAVSSAAASLASKVSSGAAAATSAVSIKPTQSLATFTGGAPAATQAAGLLGAAALAMFAL
ncbi:CFEM-domain-containing protein [Phaeosphaeriaceae sp. SRC1lsM3a]|nr:CFEM-domain-containing protein [Stagonospora sp. SRC1lsM3a]